MTKNQIKQIEEKYQTFTVEELYQELDQTSRTGIDFEFFMINGWEELGFNSFEDYCVDFTTGYIETSIINNLIEKKERTTVPQE